MKLNLGMKSHRKTTNFRGYPIYTHNVMLWLASRFENDCIIVPNKLFGDALYDSKYTSIHWDGSVNRLIAPKEFFEDWIKKCKGKRFYVMPFLYRFATGNSKISGHVNMLIYDSKLKSMERFEPYGINRWESTEDIDKHIKDLFDKEMGEGFIKHYFKPLDFCPEYSFQSMEEKGKKVKGDPMGFCRAWIVWYAEYRLSNPDIDRKDAVKYALDKIGDDANDFKNFIRSYSAFSMYMYKQSEKTGNDLKKLEVLAEKWQVKN